jgi:hypothetical protein
MSTEPFTPLRYSDEPDIQGVAIQAATITEVKNVHSFRVMVSSLELFKSVSVFVVLQDQNGTQVGSRSFTFEGEDYLGWNNDDQYLVNKVAERMGFTLSA